MRQARPVTGLATLTGHWRPGIGGPAVRRQAFMVEVADQASLATGVAGVDLRGAILDGG